MLLFPLKIEIYIYINTEPETAKHTMIMAFFMPNANLNIKG